MVAWVAPVFLLDALARPLACATFLMLARRGNPRHEPLDPLNRTTPMTRTAIQACSIPHGGSIKEEMGLLPGEYAYWAGRLAEARTATANAEAQADDAKSAALLSAKVSAAPKATVDEIKASSLLSPDYITARNQAIKAKAAQHKLEAIVAAISQKRYMLMSLGAMIRFEGSQPPPTSPDDHDHPLSNMDDSNDE